MRILKSIIIAVSALLFCTGCSGQNSKKQDNMSKSIVIFFSHAGDNYAVGDIEVGNTKIVADYITEITGADQFEIVTHKYDGLGYNPLIEIAKEESNSGELPPYEGKAPDLSQYDTVFIGFPIWWYQAPRIIETFLESYDFSGKTVITFATSGGSPLGKTESILKKLCPPETKWLPGKRLSSRESAASVHKWIASLGL